MTLTLESKPKRDHGARGLERGGRRAGKRDQSTEKLQQSVGKEVAVRGGGRNISEVSG